MGLFNRRKKPEKRQFAPNPHIGQRSGFFSGEVDRLLAGWTTQSNSIDYYLQQDLRSMRARSRELVRRNPYGKRFVSTIKVNIVGPVGVAIQAQSRRGQQLDTVANDAIEAAFKDWAAYHCDATGRMDFVAIQNMAISCAVQDGEFLFEVIESRTAGKYGFQLRAIDPELLDVEKNQILSNGEIRLGIEYNNLGKVVRYHFRRLPKGQGGSYQAGSEYTIAADQVIHGFLSEWPDQSRGIPWMHASLDTAKHLDKYDEAAMVAARTGANSAMLLSGDPGSEYEGDEPGSDGVSLENLSPGELRDIGNKTVTNWDPSYPHQLYADFVKSALRRFASGTGVSYHSLSSDLEGVNFSSIRAGVLEDREIFKGMQDWFIRVFIMPVYERWVSRAIMSGQIRIGSTVLNRRPDEYFPASYTARRWGWVDPQKDSAANKMAIDERWKSRTQIIRDQGNDPETVWREIQREEEMMAQLGIQPIVQNEASDAKEDPGE